MIWREPAAATATTIGKADRAMMGNPLIGGNAGRISAQAPPVGGSGGNMHGSNAHPPEPRPAESWSAARGQQVIARHVATEGGLLPALHDVQEVFGHVPDDAVRLLAQEFNLSRAEVHGVVTFYHEFRREPAGRHVIKLCQAEACQAMGSRNLRAHACERLGVALGETTADGRVTLEAIYCLGLCATAPSAMIDGTVLGRVTPARLDAALEALA
jgi:formate dehydrogenase subunit gamma